MRSYPWILVEAENKKDAKVVAADWIDEHLDDGPYDYGSSISSKADPENKSVIAYGEPGFLVALKDAIGCEEAGLKESWDVVKQFVLKFAACKKLPVDDRTVKVCRVLAQGINGIIEAGAETEQELSASACYYEMKKLYELRRHMTCGRGYMTTLAAVLFMQTNVGIADVLNSKVVLDAGMKLFLVHADCHS